MDKVRQFFIKIKQNTPRHTQWMLVLVALVMVIMLLAIMTGGKKTTGNKVQTATEGAYLTISPKAIDFGVVSPNDPKESVISISANKPTIVSSVDITSKSSGLTSTQNCTTMGPITDKLACKITLSLTTTGDMNDGKNTVTVKYYDANGSKDMEKLEVINVSFSVKKDEIPEIIADEPEPVQEETVEEPVLPELEPLVKATTEKNDKKTEECYEFAFAGYDNGGKQIGWIKPSGGRYMFHPFSDKTCSDPTGEYNSKTGFITSLDDPSKKIGSDSEHIGGRGSRADLAMPNLSNPAPSKKVYKAIQVEAPTTLAGSAHVLKSTAPKRPTLPSSYSDNEGDRQATVSSRPYDRTFVLRQFKPIPATIVNEVRAVKDHSILPVMATVDRNVFADNGRTIVVPAGTMMLGNVSDGDMPGPYKTIGRIKIDWYRFVRPDGVEFNFTNDDKPFSADSQGRVGVPGYGSSDYLEQMVMPMLTAIVPAVTNMIAPISDKIVNQIDLDNNVVVQSGNMRSSEMAKQEIIKSWNKVTEKLFIDMLDNTKPPFSIAAGTRITVFSPTDLIVAWCTGDSKDSCTPVEPSTDYAKAKKQDYTVGQTDPESMLGQVSSYVSGDYEKINDARVKQLMKGFETYQSKSMAANNVYKDSLDNAQGIITKDGSILKKGTKEYNEQVLGIKYKETDNGEVMIDPSKTFTEHKETPPAPSDDAATAGGLTCESGDAPDKDGCCAGETFTDMGENGWNCCPNGGGDCFPPIK